MVEIIFIGKTHNNNEKKKVFLVTKLTTEYERKMKRDVN